MGSEFSMQLRGDADADVEMEKLQKHYKDGFFVSDKFLDEWAENLNKDLTIMSHLERPFDREKLRMYFPAWTHHGRFDLGLSCMTKKDKRAIKKYVIENYDKIAWMRNGGGLLEGTNPSKKDEVLFQKFEKVDEPPEKLPADKQVVHKLEGVLPCRTWGLKESWVAYGKVKEPVYLKDRIYVDDIYNNLSQDGEGRATLLIPLRPMHEPSEWAFKVVDQMWEMGIREHPYYLASKLYHAVALDIKENQETVAEAYADFYKEEELYTRMLRELQWAHTITFRKPYIWRKALVLDHRKREQCTPQMKMSKGAMDHANTFLKALRAQGVKTNDIGIKVAGEEWRR